MSLHDRIENDFTYHPPTQDQIPKYQAIRDEAKSFAHLIDKLVPDGREKGLALTALDQVVWSANAGIARATEVNPEPEELRDVVHRSWDDIPTIDEQRRYYGRM